MLFGPSSSSMVRAGGEEFDALPAVEPFGDGVGRAHEAVLRAVHTLQRRRAWSKPAARIGRGGQEESRTAK